MEIDEVEEEAEVEVEVEVEAKVEAKVEVEVEVKVKREIINAQYSSWARSTFAPIAMSLAAFA
jgi:hypothetical protein